MVHAYPKATAIAMGLMAAVMLLGSPIAHAAVGSPQTNRALPVVTPVPEPTPPNSTGIPAERVGAVHRIVMEAVMLNYPAISKAARGSRDPWVLLRAALGVPSVSREAKGAIVSVLDAEAKVGGLSPLPGCNPALKSFRDGAPINAGDISPWLEYLSKLQRFRFPSCPTWPEGVNYAMQVAKEGGSTIYSPHWIQNTPVYGRIRWGSVGLADLGGAIAGAIGGPGGAAAGAVGASVINIADQIG